MAHPALEGKQVCRQVFPAGELSCTAIEFCSFSPDSSMDNIEFASKSAESSARTSAIRASEPEGQIAAEGTVRVLRTLAEVEEVRAAWESWPGNPDADIDFYIALLKSTPSVVRPHVMVVYRDGRPDALLVGRIDRRRFEWRLGYLRLGHQANILYLVNGALKGTGSFQNVALLVQEICDCLARGEADVAYLNLLRIDSDFYALARTRPGVFCRDRFCAIQPHYTLALPKSGQEFYQRFSSKTRSVLKSKREKLEKAFNGAIEIRCFRGSETLEAAIDVVEQLAKRSYLRGLGLGFVDSPEMRERLRMKARKGWLRTYILYGEDRPLAYWNGDLVAGTFGGNYVGYDPEFSKYSPGMYLMTKVIEGFCTGEGEGVRRIDFGHGDAEYKASLADCESREAAVHIFAPSFKGIEMSIGRSFSGAIEQGIKKVLAKADLLQKIKKSWRNHARRRLTQP